MSSVPSLHSLMGPQQVSGVGGAKTRITFQIRHGGARTFSETRLRDKELWDPGYAGETVASHAGVFRGGMKNEPP